MESASINKSLFVLAKCVEALHQEKPTRVPYRESKMTRILSLGQNSGLTVMILNLAPVRSFHLDTLGSLNFANRTKKIEVRETENEPIFKGCPRAVPTIKGESMQRQPLRPLASTVHNVGLQPSGTYSKPTDKRSKAFSVYSDNARQSSASARPFRSDTMKTSPPLKRPSDICSSSTAHPPKRRSLNRVSQLQPIMSRKILEELIERKVTDILASRVLDQPSIAPVLEISDEVRKRLEMLEQKIKSKDDGREQGLTFLLMAKQHSVRGEDTSALKMFSLAQEYFPNNIKLNMKIDRLQIKMQEKKQANRNTIGLEGEKSSPARSTTQQGSGCVSDRQELRITRLDGDEDKDIFSNAQCETDDCLLPQPRQKKPMKQLQTKAAFMMSPKDDDSEENQTPRTKRLLGIVNTRDVSQIRLLKGVGAKKAEAILDALHTGKDENDQGTRVSSLDQLERLKGVGATTVENMRCGLVD